MKKFVPTQPFADPLDGKNICHLNVDVIEHSTAPLLHPTARFWYIHSGQGRVKLQDREYDLRPGTVVSILPWQISDIVWVGAPIRYYFLAYDFDLINSLLKTFPPADGASFQLLRVLKETPVIHCNPHQARGVRHIFMDIRREIGAEPIAPPTAPADSLRGPYLVGKLMELIILYCRIGHDAPDTIPRASDSIQKSDILHYMYCNLNKKLTLEGLSRLFYMSESTISDYIRETTGLRFLDLLNEMRVGKALNYLVYTDLTLAELAEILGFVDASHISKVFYAKTGIKAGAYRRTYQNMGILCKIRNDPDTYRLIAYIYRHSAEPLTAPMVAEMFHIPPNVFQQILLCQVERSFPEFLSFLRINRACVLLKATTHPITDIAVEVGYSSRKTFDRHFLRLRGMTAGEFRKNIDIQPPVPGMPLENERLKNFGKNEKQY